MFNAKRMALMREGLSYHVATYKAKEFTEEKIKTINVKDL
jgi:hypothetical protein